MPLYRLQDCRADKLLNKIAVLADFQQ